MTQIANLPRADSGIFLESSTFYQSKRICTSSAWCLLAESMSEWLRCLSNDYHHRAVNFQILIIYHQIAKCVVASIEKKYNQLRAKLSIKNERPVIIRISITRSFYFQFITGQGFLNNPIFQRYSIEYSHLLEFACPYFTSTQFP